MTLRSSLWDGSNLTRNGSFIRYSQIANATVEIKERTNTTSKGANQMALILIKQKMLKEQRLREAQLYMASRLA
jgi:hypothetical protein